MTTPIAWLSSFQPSVPTVTPSSTSWTTAEMTPPPAVSGLGRAGMTRMKSTNKARSRKP